MIRMARLFRLATSGASSIEFALIAAFLMIPLVLGVYDFGTALWSFMQVGNAARSGAQFINVNGYSSSYTTSGNSCPSTPTNTLSHQPGQQRRCLGGQFVLRVPERHHLQCSSILAAVQ